ncbi:DUF5133 domain-containing protein [Streptomyces sp. NPDC005899]|uniref:DUF5133 domain-containing protein n=1 Tax=Streptomyces sp. NPDC005899 TaxID=3155716 RepID=UPI0033FFDE9C
MLTPSPQDLRVALARYADARIEDARRSTDATVRAVEDATYTLCVMTGTREISQALHTADTMLGPRPAKTYRAHPLTAPEQGDRLQAA